MHLDQLIVLESTTYPGTTEEIVAPMLEAGNPNGLKVSRAIDQPGIHVVFSPEREDPGNDTIARHDIPKVIGGCGPVAADLASALYSTIFRHVVPVSTPSVAEMTKLLENIYRCVNIALVNELKQLCMRMGIDINEVIEAAKTKPFGFQPFYPGPGLGGHCIPIDPFYLSWKAKEFDFRTRFIELAGAVNTDMPYFVISQIAEALNNCSKAIKGSKILVLGLAYKRDIDDLRESPSLTIIELLRDKGAIVAYNDPYIPALWLRPPLRPKPDQHPARQSRPVRRGPHCHRPLELRLSRNRGPIATRHRHPQRHQRHRLLENRPLLS